MLVSPPHIAVSEHLKRAATYYKHIPRDLPAKCQLPEVIPSERTAARSTDRRHGLRPQPPDTPRRRMGSRRLGGFIPHGHAVTLFSNWLRIKKVRSLNSSLATKISYTTRPTIYDSIHSIRSTCTKRFRKRKSLLDITPC